MKRNWAFLDRFWSHFSDFYLSLDSFFISLIVESSARRAMWVEIYERGERMFANLGTGTSRAK